MKESEQMGRNLNREKLHLVAVKGGSSRYEFKRSGRSVLESKPLKHRIALSDDEY